MQYRSEPNRSTPESWQTTSYTVRRPGCTAWEDRIARYADARRSQAEADQTCRGHRVYAEQEYVGDLPELRGQTRTVEL